MSTAPDRITSLLAQDDLTGIDFIDVDPGQNVLDVYFLRDVSTLNNPLPGTIPATDIIIYSLVEGLPAIEVLAPPNWMMVDGQNVLRLTTNIPGDFILYKLKINDARIDPWFNDVTFSFKANCPSDLDCAPPAHECPPDELVDFPVDYLARDFWSFRTALLDFAAIRYPNWADRLESDAGVMLAEVMSAIGDEMAYYQDRVAREGYLETATQRRSIRRHARLVDYQMHDGLGAFVWLELMVQASNQFINAGETVYAISDNEGSIPFEIGRGIQDSFAGNTYNIDALRNEFSPHLWDEDQNCLAVGTTSFYLEGHHAANLPFDDFTPDPETGKITPGKWVLIKTVPPDPSQQVRRQIVRLTTITDSFDPVLLAPITFIQWEAEDALVFEFDFTILKVNGNIVPATSGHTRQLCFIVNREDAELSPAAHSALDNLPLIDAVFREGHDGSPAPRVSLPGADDNQLVYLGATADKGIPEIILQRLTYAGGAWVPFGEFWTYTRSMVGVNSSQAEDKHFTLDDGNWQRLAGYQRIGRELVHRDYAFNSGVTIRFGDGEFGQLPGTNYVYQVSYRLGSGNLSNVAADSITQFAAALPFGVKVTNPLAASNGIDAETPVALRQVVSDAFRTITYRAVRPEDYTEAAERLPWVQKAGAVFRWTGSWLTCFVTADPIGKVVMSETEKKELRDQMNRFRQAGREVYINEPQYANIDLEINLCINPDSYRGEVKEAVMEAMMGTTGVRSVEGYFSSDRFTFGTALERSSLEAAIQSVPGVRAVEQIRFRRRGWFTWRIFKEYTYNPGKNAIVRVENNLLRPERGTLKLYTHGGL